MIKKTSGLTDYPDLMQKLLRRVGVKTRKAAEEYLKPDYERDLHDPFLMKDMAKAVERIILAIKSNEKVIIFADYDADGVPGAALLATFFKQIGFLNFDVYIPDRHNEAYGLSEKIVEKFHECGKDLIITIDCGITDVAEIKLANKLGLEVIVTDHHIVQEKVPPAFAIINPKQSDDEYPEKMLCGCGVVFKLVQALIARGNFNLPVGAEKWLLDLVAISTISDMVPISGENRTLAYFGLKVLRQTRCPGLKHLLSAVKIKPATLSEDDIAFTIGPRINTASRMSHASQAYYLLTTDDPKKVVTITDHLIDRNADRREAVDKITRDVSEALSEGEVPAVIVLGGKDWSLGVLGLAATRVVEKYQRPTFLWGENGQGEIKGSCRGDGSINVVELMTKASEDKVFTDFGGHAEAGGFSMSAQKIDKLAPALIKAYQALPRQVKKKEIEIIDDITLDEVTLANWQIIEAVGPYGVGNPKPIFRLRNVKIESAKVFGNSGLHLELSFKNSLGQKIPAIGFFSYPDGLTKESVKIATDHRFGEVLLEAGNYVDMLINLELSHFKYKPELRLRIVDVQPVK